MESPHDWGLPPQRQADASVTWGLLPFLAWAHFSCSRKYDSCNYRWNSRVNDHKSQGKHNYSKLLYKFFDIKLLDNGIMKNFYISIAWNVCFPDRIYIKYITFIFRKLLYKYFLCQLAIYKTFRLIAITFFTMVGYNGVVTGVSNETKRL